MTAEKAQLLILKVHISELPADDRAKVDECAAKLRAAITEAGDHGLMALALVGAEEAAK